MQETWKQKLRPLYQNTPFFDLVMGARNRKHRDDWLEGGKSTPAPHLVKQLALVEYAEKFGPKVLIETGTFRGDMLYFLRNHFRALYSIELLPEFHRRATKRFASYPHIHLIHGDSGEKLAGVLKDISEPCLFWLDGHYSGNVTARASKDTPIVEELVTISAHPIKNHVLLIDDAHCFDGTHDYPTIEALRAQAAQLFPQHSFEVRDSVIRIAPPAKARS